MLFSHLHTYIYAERDRDKETQKERQTDRQMGEGGWTSKRKTETEHQDMYYTYNLCP